MSVVRKGTYILLMTFSEDIDIKVGALGNIHFKSGLYCYVGSAMGGLDQRVSRHLSVDKKVKWHVDYLTLAADKVEAYESFPNPIPECELGHLVESIGCVQSVPGFGCSDCSCTTHLYTVPMEIKASLTSLNGLQPFRASSF